MQIFNWVKRNYSKSKYLDDVTVLNPSNVPPVVHNPVVGVVVANENNAL